MAHSRPASVPTNYGASVPITSNTRTQPTYSTMTADPLWTSGGIGYEPHASPAPVSVHQQPVSVHQQPVSVQQQPVSVHQQPVKETVASHQRAPYVCEFLGTFMLAFTFACCSYTATANKVWYFTAIACAYIVIMYAVGFVSGGHLNPAVSLAAFFVGRISLVMFFSYAVLQILGGILAGFLFELVFLVPAPGVVPMTSFTFTQAAVAEFLYTTMLCFVAVNVLCSARNAPDNGKNQFFALAIGFAILAGGYAIGDISGAWLNPALSLGLNISGWWRGSGVLSGCLYAAWELLGAGMAALLFRACRPDEYESWHSWVGEHGFHIQDHALFPRLVSEFLGTFFLVLTFCLNVAMSSVATAWSVSGALLCMVYALGNVSGGHFNPAVTAAVILSGRDKCSMKDGVCYVIVQFFGALAASLVTMFIRSSAPVSSVHFGVWGLNEVYPWGAAMTAELLFTFLLAYVVLAVSTCETSSQHNCYFGLAIGFTLAAGIVAAGGVSGGYMNPAVALGFAVEDMPTFASARIKPDFPLPILRAVSFVHQFVSYMSGFVCYSAFELLGAVMAAGMFRLTHPAEYCKKTPLPSHTSFPAVIQ